MRGIRFVSESLSDLIDSLPEHVLPKVIDESLTLILQDFANDPDIREAISRYHAGSARPDDEFASYLAGRSRDADAGYIRLEQAGAPEVSYNLEYRRYFVLFALSRIFSARDITLQLVDDVVAELGNGASDTTRFGIELERNLRSALG